MAETIDERWQIQEKLGEGAQGETFLVVDQKGEAARVVLKRLKNPNSLPRFKQEIEALGKLDHPHVVRLIYANPDAEKPYLVSEFCGRGTIEQRKTEILQATIARRFDVFEQICAGVKAAHDAGIVHRDIKPANLFVRENDHVVVGDFGICFIQSPERLTETMEAVGARFYMAPELADGRADEVTVRSDIYSLGKVLYWLFTGKAFDREDHRRADRLLTTWFPDPSILHVHRLLDHMIVHKPSARIANSELLKMEVARTRRLVEGKYPTLEHPPHLCHYCGNGTYKMIANSKDRSAVFNFGLDPTNSGPHIFVCDTCGHAEMFRPAYSKNPEWLP